MSITILTHTQTDLTDAAPDLQHLVRMRARDLEASAVLHAHTHDWGQVTYAPEGTLRVSVGNSTWIVPPLRAIWIPPQVMHEIKTIEKAQLRALYIHTSAAPFQGNQCIVLEVTSLLREMIAALFEADENSHRESLLNQLILNELAQAETQAFQIALPTEKRLLTLCKALLDDPGSPMTLGEWAHRVGASERTLARLFERDLGLTFGQWRQQIRLAHAAPMITRGMPLSMVAAKLGYASQSAFSAMFKKTFGEAPSTFFTARKSRAGKAKQG
ncbi:AraC family transcriptional regulator [Glaciimonas immobilis]|uniref:AraC-like DNA-binding protein/quercetin dioxygenase-like cupin family protein n=1 Tax=Glaciimonas immobilis TaxID=728004 RepID=A0A840RSY0_9BURK|nr:helix-turn-helix transcriptional regulator [Glaciimonas immobilis]KAF3997412.1 helix-turn-helix transcriptional regulator [Glaciimonas immobilis]MBB5200925.1 AraC-like DNA-binding protein/quercetin dioxygenase-like cupin family protein [Glaciimonas immobilis]